MTGQEKEEEGAMNNFSAGGIQMVKYCLLVMFFFCASCIDHWVEISIANNSDEKIFALCIARAGERELHREAINAHDAIYELKGTESEWETSIQFNGGWLIRLYPYQFYDYSKEALDSIAPLKSWVIRNWNDLEAHNAKLKYP
jgi:hypothetical protein